jgi:hypothetical protein
MPLLNERSPPSDGIEPDAVPRPVVTFGVVRKALSPEQTCVRSRVSIE